MSIIPFSLVKDLFLGEGVFRIFLFMEVFCIGRVEFQCGLSTGHMWIETSIIILILHGVPN